MTDEKTAAFMPLEQVKAAATSVSEQLKSAADPLTPALRKSFVDVRAALFQRGVFDPILVRFDSATVARASVAEIAEELGRVATSL